MSSHGVESHTPGAASGMTSRSIASMAIDSGRHFVSLARHGALRRPPDRMGQLVLVDDGRAYQIFRETVSDAAPAETPNVLVVGFQLNVLAAHPIPHWIFQRCCLLTTPFWSGLPGFSVKLWMVDPESKRYLGIYDWRGTGNAQQYVDALVRVLNPLSTTGSVWYRLLPDQTLDPYLAEHAANPARSATGARP